MNQMNIRSNPQGLCPCLTERSVIWGIILLFSGLTYANMAAEVDTPLNKVNPNVTRLWLRRWWEWGPGMKRLREVLRYSAVVVTVFYGDTLDCTRGQRSRREFESKLTWVWLPGTLGDKTCFRNVWGKITEPQTRTEGVGPRSASKLVLLCPATIHSNRVAGWHRGWCGCSSRLRREFDSTLNRKC